jgi:EAL domain-containing protein (putative c-di-GMP-specific phosphodiesterase class I)
LNVLTQAGFRLGLDDVSVRSIPKRQTFSRFDYVKIDASMVYATRRSGLNMADYFAPLTAAINDANSLLMAEGVEHNTELIALKQLGCDHAQGTLLCAEMPLSGLLAKLSGNRLNTFTAPHHAGPSG